jgi:hypothetical protein
MMKIVGSVAFALVLASNGSCKARTVVKQEPMEGKVVPGQVILVDDGTCGKAKIKEVTGGGRCDGCQTSYQKMHPKWQDPVGSPGSFIHFSNAAAGSEQ